MSHSNILFQDGIGVIWETIGGKTTETLLDHLAENGRMIVIGGITGYIGEGFPEAKFKPGQLILKGQSINGFCFFKHGEKFHDYLKKLIELVESKELTVITDSGENSVKGTFKGIEKVADAVEHLFTGKSIGKVIVPLF